MGNKKGLRGIIKENWKKAIIGGVFITLSGLSGLWIGNSRRLEEHRKLYKDMMNVVADSNRVGQDELAKIYQKFGIPYDGLSANPHQDLSAKQMKEYLSNIRQTSEPPLRFNFFR